ncbi:type II secretion system F family protein [Bacterioplanoides sp.]|uniref:type II secretion system F family protein n=1 Tax=Bacterioplanoides sp. TaxID=2066072 RepID=UPI003B598B3F
MSTSSIAILLLIAGALLIGFAVYQQLQNQQRRQKLLQLQNIDAEPNKDSANGLQTISVSPLSGNQNEQIAVVVQAFKNFVAWLDGRFRLPPAQIVLARQAGFIHPGNEAGQTSLVILGRYFWLSKIITAVIAALWLWPEGQKAMDFLLLIIAMVIANLIPEALFGLFCRDRARRLQGQLPQVFDLLALCLEAGLSIDAALARIGEEMRAVNPALAKHFAALSDDLRITNSRSHAFNELAQRLPLDDLRQLSWLIAQADDYGTPLAEGLRELAGHSRTIHGLALEERMAKVPAQMSVPLMVFIILPLVALLAGPAFIMLIRQLSGEG